MKDPIGLIVALLFTGWGASALVFPQWYYRTTTAAQDARNRKIFRILGVVLLPAGLILLVGRFLGWWD
jgi:uncharacterized protein YjeT (DUF2065 family)